MLMVLHDVLPRHQSSPCRLHAELVLMLLMQSQFDAADDEKRRCYKSMFFCSFLFLFFFVLLFFCYFVLFGLGSNLVAEEEVMKKVFWPANNSAIIILSQRFRLCTHTSSEISPRDGQ